MARLLQETGDALLVEDGDFLDVDAVDPGAGVGTGAGDSTATAVALAIWPSAASGAGDSSALGAGLDAASVVASAASAAGDSTAIAIGQGVWPGVGTAAGTSTADADGAANRAIPPGWLTALLNPVVIDDGWGGTLRYAWTQVSGPATATIETPGARETNVGVPQTITGAYFFRITVSRARDAFIATALWRVYALAAGAQPNDARGAVTVTANGVAKTGLVESVRIREQLNGVDTCSFSFYGGAVDDLTGGAAAFEVFNDVVITRHNDVTGATVRMFAGVCRSLEMKVTERQLFYSPSLVGYAWHLGRVKVTKTYTAQSISAIAADLLGMAPGGITGDYIAPNLPLATLAFDDVTIADALTELAAHERGLHWRVDYFKRLHFGVYETAADEPLGLSPAHPSLSDLAITRDGTDVVNRVTVTYDKVVTLAVLVDAEIEVDSLDGYSSSGGDTTIDGNTIHYTGTASRTKHPVTSIVVYFSQTAVSKGGPFLPGYHTNYRITFVTDEGETPTQMISQGAPAIGESTNAYELRLTALDATRDPLALPRLKSLNIYRDVGLTNLSGGNGPFQGIFLVGSMSIPGRTFVDTLADNDIPLPFKSPPETGVNAVLGQNPNTADAEHHYLTGCSGSQDVHVAARVTVNNTAAQAALATALGGGDSGIVEVTLQGGSISDVEAQQLAAAFLAASVDLRQSVACTVRDDDAHPGHVLSVNFPAPIACVADLPIQTVDISGFTKNVPHALALTAAIDVVTIEDLLRPK